MPDPSPQSTPTGSPDRRKRDAWLLLALIGDADIDAARRYWQTHAPLAMAGVPTGDGWTWDDQKQIYVAPNRHKVDQHDLKRLSLLFALAVAADLRKMGNDVAMGETPIDEWQTAAAQVVKDAAIAQGALAAGGFDNLTGEMRQIITGDAEKAPGLAFTLSKLADFAEDIEQHNPRADSVGAITDRMALYSSGQNGVLEAVKRASHAGAKNPKGQLLYLFERNLLGDAQHCHDTDDAEGCTECTDAGWVPIGSLPLPGLRSCRASCACSMQFSLTGPATENN